ncbi:efflux RND transporter periplasmic adaptor subunit [Lacimicrobium alkaliphilum]|uniref:Resistance-nodulation-cell division (RND) multidrug efflux membrane fusion protein MexE n=1 Tax=Lacimicrobium alkaliphilum TaxID=1526571 RepID=A0ABQ1R6Q0_9ALTE|nr:efflux RND transporter periplasmic adaptor subunit [Lacimicrobium alkaliphilum]GGD60299.1 resistance-nodulation-cell division (RND) multidrug efflux membrane fusion protein MexE [Lacimicrobium alkaliphilum]
MSLRYHLQIGILLGSLILLVACGSDHQTEQQQMPAPQVSVASVVSERITEWDEFTGRLEAPQTVELRPRVSGYIDLVAFEEGALVEAGQPLFLIDNKPFKAEVRRLQAQLEQAQSQLSLAETEYQRAQKLSGQAAISQEVLDTRRAQLQQAEARIRSVSAALDVARLNRGYTRVTAPISGRVSRALITQGNYVSAGQSLLTTIVSTKKIYAYFDADEQTYLNYLKLAEEGSRPAIRDAAFPVYVGLANDTEYPHAGKLDFMDNQVNPATGTIRARAVLNNQEGRLLPGLFARIKMTGSASYNGILVDDRAIGTDLNNKFVLVLDESDKVQYRAVELGEKIAGLRIIRSGLSATDKIVVNGLQRVRPGSPVRPEFVNMTNDETLDKLQAMQQKLDKQSDLKELARKNALPDAVIGG